ncbi:MAG TPA: DNA-protecting protein DprA [Methyloprofundus sp.]|uniref:DNA-processing protein DprA n=1 Tax=Methyloprofundus sp. TaxID=2020875 RepID=UPI00182601FE|nr:DNA-processing protein DprA [Methyloprofundus sp.]HIG64219.1 DNA-protecting protein DprA [Methyloprofundus sp.]HIL78949.1 DNA-protecting protein DprA [Methylococcales bacterium]
MRTPGIGSKTFLKCLEYCPPEQLFSTSRDTLLKLGLRRQSIDAIKNPDWSIVEQDLLWLEQDGNHILLFTDQDYPPQLKEIPDPPPILFARGDVDLIHFPQIAIVGSRNPSSSGIQIATEFASNLASIGFTITSGLALGIDAAGHRGALAVKGKTIAVTGTGLDRVYPAAHKELATEIINNGVLISEFPPGTSAKANHFPRRNRIISGLCVGLLVVEAAKQSGSLISARMALEQNREVFAIPGSIHNPLARGCNALIQEGAKLVETTHDILDELGHFFHQPIAQGDIASTQATNLDAEQQNLLNYVLYSPTSIDQLVNETGFSVEIIASHLLILEIQGYIIATNGGTYTRIK